MATDPQTRLLDFDAVFPNTISVKRRNKQLDLRDDIPLEEVVRVFPMIERQDALKGQDDAAEFVAAFEDVKRMALERCTAFVRHTYPEMTQTEVADWLTFEQQLQVVMLFFQARSNLSFTQLSGPDNDSMNQSPASTTSNRAARRTRAKPVKTANSSSATASRPRTLPGKAGATTQRTR